MKMVCLLLIITFIIITAVQSGVVNPKHHYGYLPPQPSNQNNELISITLQPPMSNIQENNLINENSLFAALLLSTSLSLQPKTPSYNHPEHLPLNPYLSLLLSHYGKFVPIYGTGRGIYSYNAVNNYHNNKPFGSYKIYNDYYNN